MPLAIAGTALVVAAAAALGFQFGKRAAGLDYEQLQSLVGSDAEQRARLVSMERRLVDAELAASVDGQAVESLKETLDEQLAQISDLREEVRFYKRLMAPSDLERGLQIAEFELSPTAGAREVGYDLLLTQATERRSWVQGKVRVDVLGERAGEQVVISLQELAQLDAYPLKFRFRYFQDFTGTLSLPEGFEPVRVVVTAQRSNGDELQKAFEWTPGYHVSARGS